MKLASVVFGLSLAVITGFALANGGVPSAVCYVEGKLVFTNMPVNVCQSVLKGDPQKAHSFKK